MMHKQVWCMSSLNEAWHGKVQQTILQVSGAQYATSCILTEHHINYLVHSRLGTQQY